ncbi:MAG: ABC transporter ATP-binding protein [Planctomycetes bacterium]|nr:ABC transporter ATP-binding protein [Planctomycetota bacterium]
MSEAAVRVEGLRKSYRSGFWRRRSETLRGVSFSVPVGRAVGYLGANGVGKTTTLKILVGLLEPDGGTAEVLGLPVHDPACRRRVGFLPENPYFYEHLTAREALRFYGGLSRMAGAEVEARIDPLLAKVGLEKAADRRLGEYSKGMRQRLGLAQALLHDPELLILDEPMSGLDPFGRLLVKDLILEERARGKTIFFSSHILADVEEVCDFAVIVADGRITASGTVRELLGRGVTEYEVAVRGAGAAALEPAAPGRVRFAREDGDLLRARLPGDVDPAALQAAVAAKGGVIVELVPRRETLEDLFLRTGGTATGGDAGGGERR